MFHSSLRSRGSHIGIAESLNSLAGVSTIVTNTTPNSTRSEVRVMTTKVGTTTSLAGTVGDKGIVMAMRVGVVMRKVVTMMREMVRATMRVENTTTRD